MGISVPDDLSALDFGRIENREKIEAFLRRDAAAHVYALADLDDFFWPETIWYTASTGTAIHALCLLLHKLEIPVLYAICPPNHEPTRRLLAAICTELPERFFVNLDAGMLDVFAARNSFESVGEHQKMILSCPLPETPGEEPERLTVADLDELQEFYAQRAYRGAEASGRFFEPYMLELGPYVGFRESGELISAGGVHVRSRDYRVAAIGNIATSPDHRRRGLGRRITADLCRKLQADVDYIGMNVDVENTAAIRCYEGLGFRPVRRYVEGIFTRL